MGHDICDPYIYNNKGCTPSSCELLWQDALNLVTDVKLSKDNQLVFTVNRATIQEGNAVVAVRGTDNKIMWSWHIWVTDENKIKTQEITNKQNEKFHIMLVNLGWCDANTINYDERSCKIKITAGNQHQEFIVKQKSQEIKYDGSCTYYQWGRKDPLIPSNGIVDQPKTWYNANGIASTTAPLGENFPTGKHCIINGIQKTTVKNLSTDMDNIYINLWNINANNSIVKTVYDPCPIGFQLPNRNTFLGFSVTTSTGGWIEKANAKGAFNRGWDFYCNPKQTGNTIFFPAAVFWDAEGTSLTQVNKMGHSWLAMPKSSDTGKFLYFDYKGVCTSHNKRSYALPIRPVKE